MPAFVTIDGLAFKSSLQVMLDQLDAMGQTASLAVTQAMVEYAEYLLALMQANAPKLTGALLEGGHVLAPRVEGDFIVVEIRWDEPYSHIQDVGGTITAKDFRATFNPDSGRRHGAGGRFVSQKRLNTARLFIPLRPGVKPIRDKGARAAAGYRYGIDFVLARAVDIKGNRYITKVMESEAKNADRTVGRLAEKIWAALLGLSSRTKSVASNPGDLLSGTGGALGKR